jgi:hypothetical protein
LLVSSFNTGHPASAFVKATFRPLARSSIAPKSVGVHNTLPHRERACEPLPGGDDGKWVFESIFAALKNKTVAVAA